MIRKYFLLLSILPFIHPLSSIGQQFNLEIIGGVTSSQISGDGFYGFAQFGAIAGADVNYKINDDWSSSFGLQFNQKGARTYTSEKSSIIYRLRVNYVEAPINLNYHFNKVSIRAGFYLGVKINQKERTSFGPIDPVRPFNTFDFGGQLGINYAITDNWQVELRFQNSLIPVREHLGPQAFSPALFLMGDWHQSMLNEGQYYTSLSLVLRYLI